jgi:hypothetical protein
MVNNDSKLIKFATIKGKTAPQTAIDKFGKSKLTPAEMKNLTVRERNT